MVRPYLNEVGGKVENDISLFTGGLNAYVDKAFLEADQMPYVMNLKMTRPPSIETRTGRTSIARYMENQRWDYNIGAVIDLWTYSERQFYAVTEREGVRKIVEVYIPDGEDEYTAKDLINIPKENRYYFTLARQANNEYLYVTGLTFKVKITIHENPLTTTATMIDDFHYGICCCHKGRLFLGNPDSNRIVFSALYDYDNFDEMQQYQVVTNPLDMADTSIVYLMQDANADNLWDKYVWDESQDTFVQDGTIAKTELIIDTTTGLSMPDYSVIAGEFKVTNSIGKLISLKSFDDKMIIFCEHSMHCLYGDTPDISMQNQYQLVDLNNNLGAIADRCIAIGGGKLYWLGDNQEVYEYTGSAINIISRPGKTRNSTLSIGGISSLIDAQDIHNGQDIYTGNSHSKFVATSERLYINIWNAKDGILDTKLLLVFDVYNRVWWCEDGDFNTIGNYSDHTNRILLGLDNGDILISRQDYKTFELPTNDTLYDFDTNTFIEKPIEYEFHTRVYGADGVDLRKTLADVWFQADANASVYINDVWTSRDDWSGDIGLPSNLVKIGDLTRRYQPPQQPTQYRPTTYEQQVCYVEKMYGQRLNTFQIVVKGTGFGAFYLMKREWRAR